MSSNIVAFPAVSRSIGRLLDRLVLRPLASWRAREAAYSELMALDDHMLSDIGISRSQIPGILAGEMTRHPAANENKPAAVA